MLMAIIEFSSVFYANLIQKLEGVKRRTPIHVDVFTREGVIYVIGLDDGFSAAFVYSSYRKAREKGLKTSLMYARFIDESVLPEEVRKLGEAWLRKKLSMKEVEALKKMMITEHVFDKWCKVL
jgi:hypothetical protein